MLKQENDLIIPRLLELWQEQKEILGKIFKKRDRNAAQKPMELSIGYFFECLFEVNGYSVSELTNWQKEIKHLRIKPINVIERLEFIMDKPNNYHSFIQLSQLFDEFTKQYHKSLVLGKKNPS